MYRGVSLSPWFTLIGLLAASAQTVSFDNAPNTPVSKTLTTTNAVGYSQGIVTGDFNNDGKLDLVVVTNGSPSHVQVAVVFLGKGDGTFLPGVEYLVGKSSQMVVAAPLTGRNYPGGGPILDLAVPNFGDGTITILSGNGDGTFNEFGKITVPQSGLAPGTNSNPYYIAAADFNDDGKLDIICSLANSTQYAMFIGTGGGNFTASNVEATQRLGWVGAAPFSNRQSAAGHPIMDLVALGPSTVTFFGGNNDGTFHSTIRSPLGFNTNNGFPPDSTAAIGDVDGDGKLDIVVPDELTGKVWVLRGIGDGNFMTPVAYTALPPDSTGIRQASAVVIADLDGRNGPDLAVVTRRNSDPRPNLAILLNKGDGTFLPAETIDAGPNPQLLATGDFNGDKQPDIGVTNAIFGTPSVAEATVLLNSNQAMPPPTPLLFVPATPCRVFDTRLDDGPLGGPNLTANGTRAFPVLSSACGIPADAAVYSMNVAVVPNGPLGYVTIWPVGQAQPVVATLNSLDGRIKTNPAIIPAGTSGDINVFATDGTAVIMDINGYFSPANRNGLAFYPLTPCRVADTRGDVGDLGGPTLTGGSTRTFPILESACGLPTNALAYSLNLTAIPPGPLGYLTAWPTGQVQPLTAALLSFTGTVVSSAALLPAGTDGNVNVYVTDNTDLLVDINGYFAPPAAGGLSFYPLQPCRIEDTRLREGYTPVAGLVFDVDATTNACGVPTTAAVLSLNVTVVPAGTLDFISMWAKSDAQVGVTTLSAFDGAITNNMAIVKTSAGAFSVYTSDPTHVVIDINGYFAP